MCYTEQISEEFLFHNGTIHKFLVSNKQQLTQNEKLKMTLSRSSLYSETAMKFNYGSNCVTFQDPYCQSLTSVSHKKEDVITSQ